jgi:hypothetical protein
MAISLVSDDAPAEMMLPAEKWVPCYLEGTFDYAIGKSALISIPKHKSRNGCPKNAGRCPKNCKVKHPSALNIPSTTGD